MGTPWLQHSQQPALHAPLLPPAAAACTPMSANASDIFWKLGSIRCGLTGCAGTVISRSSGALPTRSVTRPVTHSLSSITAPLKCQRFGIDAEILRVLGDRADGQKIQGIFDFGLRDLAVLLQEPDRTDRA